MNGKIRRNLTALTMASAMVALAACSPSSSSSSSGSSGDSKNVTLSVWSWRTEDVAAYKTIFAVYEKQHPGTKVDFKAFKNTEYNLILTTGLAGAKGPDVAQVRSYGQLQPTIASKSLLPLDGVVDLSSWDANVVKSAKGKDDGKLYAVPLAQQTLQMYYNKDIFAKNGLTPPTTWAEFMAVNAKLKQAGVVPMAVGAKDSWTLPMLHQVLAAPRFGGSAFEKAVITGQKTFNDPNWIASVDVVNKLKPYMPDSVVGVAYTDAQILFTSGKAAMFPGGSFELGFFQKQNPAMKMGVFQVPAP
jgi:raffinose/stachyose/melibiose transport system substrate-binding protein